MDGNSIDNLNAVERTRYFKALIEKINNTGSIYAPNLRSKSLIAQPKNNSIETSKTKLFLLKFTKNSEKIDLKRAKTIPQQCDIRRIKFVKHPSSDPNESENVLINTPESNDENEIHQTYHQVEITNLDDLKEASCEAEKRILREIYTRQQTSNVEKSHMKSLVKKQGAHIEINKVDHDKNKFSQYATETEKHSPRYCAKANTEENEITSRRKPQTSDNFLSKPNATNISNSIVARENTISTADGVISNEEHNKGSRALTLISDQRSQPAGHSNKTGKRRRRMAGQLCAHCQQIIPDVAFFNGTRQLCVNCADWHFRRVTTARFTNRPMSYREYKIVGGDTVDN